MMTRIMQIVFANGLPTTGERPKAGIILIITRDYIDRREAWRSLKRFVGPQYLVEPPYIEGTFEGPQAA
jgi:hypothetical protein